MKSVFRVFCAGIVASAWVVAFGRDRASLILRHLTG